LFGGGVTGLLNKSSVAAKGVGREIIVIGEGMGDRVIPTAKSRGATWYDPPKAPPEQWMGNNQKWINKKMDDGCRILDCGAAPGRANYPGATSPYYKMELDQIKTRKYPVEKVKAEGE
jgi:hypothetical protein